MSIVANEGSNVLVGYNFMLRVEGMYDLPCKAVHSFTKENEFEYVQEGGLNDYVHMLRKPISKPFSFTVERYVGTDPYPVLPMGAELVLPVILMVSPYPREFGKSKRTFVFTGCTVMSKTYGELNAEKSGILTETIVIGYREMTEVTIPVHFDPVGGNLKTAEDLKDEKDESKKTGSSLWKKDIRRQQRNGTETESEKRRWLARNGEKSQASAKKREVGTDVVNSTLPQRYWIETTLSFGDIKDSEAKKDAAELKTTKQIAPAVPRIKTRSAKDRQKLLGLNSAEGEQRYWVENTIFPEGYNEKKTNRVRIKKQSAKTHYGVTQIEAPKAKTQRYWIKNTIFPEGYSEEKTNAPRVQQKSAKTHYWATQIEAPKAKVQRYWIKNTIFPKGYTEEKNDAPRVQEQSAKTRYSATQQDDPKVQDQRYWIKNTLFPKGYTEEKTNVPRIQKQSAKTRYLATQQNDPEAQNQRYWIKNTLFPQGYTEEKTNVPRIQKQSAKTRAAVIGKVKEEDKATRLWKIDQNSAAGTGKASHKFRVATAPVQRRWSEGQSSAKKNKNTKVKPIAQRRWEFDNTAVEGNANRSSKFGPNSKAQGRKWKISKQNSAGTGEQSAAQAPNSKPKGRKWVISKGKGKGDKSAVHSPNTTSKKRKWEMTGNVSGKGSKSANKGPNSTPDQRSWPRVSSARQYEEGGKGIPSRKWPEVSSARQYEG